ncbi:isoleucyl-tRNA synthetase [Pholiota conissans]|uniref:Isoleucine--tRNA ligase, mitochondrial n=1 Tax=Pholiota conissans TaxID=109636 RepID=A0A9P6D427_9AGAR|nr:isoleucyl-tRNA synthetase [Pholiota conissans]
MTTRLACSWNTWLFRRQAFSRYLSGKAKKSSEDLDNKAFADTLLLPKTAFPLRPNFSENEAAYGELTRETLYRWQRENVDGPVWVLHDGPPYANGDLHMGHALNKVIKDIINRFHLTQGRKIHYVPGWDCHGLPIENKALKEMDRKAIDTPASVIRDGARATALREINSQREQFKTLGVMADWNSEENTYRTLDRHYEMRQLRIFQKMVEKGQIYRQHRPVHYSPSSRTALAEAELEYSDNHVSHSVYVTFDLDAQSAFPDNDLQVLISNTPNVQLLVWTTTPWTLSANMAIAVHEELIYAVIKRDNAKDGSLMIVAEERLEALKDILGPIEILVKVEGKNLVGATYKPIFAASARSLPIVAAAHVTSQSGTGLVHCAPAHGAEDYDALRDLNTTTGLICHVDAKGQFVADIADIVGAEFADRLAGKEVLGDGNKEMVALLKEIGCLVKIQRIKHRYPYDWRTKEPIIVTATSQWFANLDFIKEDALTTLKDVSFFPESSRNRLEAFVRSRSEWCISRQRVWGVPIPALQHIATGRVVLDSPTLDYILNAMETKNLDWWDAPISEFVPPWLLEDGKTADETWEKGRDTMDVWFDSGSSWSMLPETGVGRDRVGVPGETGRKHDADLCLEGSDQHRGWFQSQLLTAIGSRGADEAPVSPYANLFTHGMVLDEKGKKMSKSLGNIISPMNIVHGSSDKRQPPYGPDFLRLWAASVDFWKDMSIGPIVIAQSAEALRKFRNTARFCLGNMGSNEDLAKMQRVPRNEMGLAEKYVVHELYTLEQTALEAYRSYNFPRVVHALNNFVNNTVSSFYFDITKDCLYADSVDSRERRAVVTVLEQILDTLTKIMSPILPYLAEEIHAIRKGDGKSVFMTPWIPLSTEWKDERAAEDMNELLRIRTTALSLLEKARREKQVKSSLEADIRIIVPDGIVSNSALTVLRREANILQTLFIVSRVTLDQEMELSPSSQPEWSHDASLPLAECHTLTIRVEPATQQKCPRCWTYTRSEEDTLCKRCEGVVEGIHTHS